MDEQVERLTAVVQQLAARSLVQRNFIELLVRRLATDVPEFNIELLREGMYLTVENFPHTPGTSQAPLQAAGRDEVEVLVTMVESVIEDRHG